MVKSGSQIRAIFIANKNIPITTKQKTKAVNPIKILKAFSIMFLYVIVGDLEKTFFKKINVKTLPLYKLQNYL